MNNKEDRYGGFQYIIDTFSTFISRIDNPTAGILIKLIAVLSSADVSISQVASVFLPMIIGEGVKDQFLAADVKHIQKRSLSQRSSTWKDECSYYSL